MLPCECGGKMYRHSRNTMKTTGQLKQVFRCQSCGGHLSFYSDDGKEWELSKRSASRPANDDKEFLAALKRFRNGNENTLRV